jgi:hypothetical protein
VDGFVSRCKKTLDTLTQMSDYNSYHGNFGPGRHKVLDMTSFTREWWFRRHPWRTGALVIVCVGLAYFVYLCLPHGYRHLEQLESRLEQSTPLGARIEDVRAFELGCRTKESCTTSG